MSHPFPLSRKPNIGGGGSCARVCVCHHLDGTLAPENTGKCWGTSFATHTRTLENTAQTVEFVRETLPTTIHDSFNPGFYLESNESNATQRQIPTSGCGCVVRSLKVTRDQGSASPRPQTGSARFEMKGKVENFQETRMPRALSRTLSSPMLHMSQRVWRTQKITSPTLEYEMLRDPLEWVMQHLIGGGGSWREQQ